MRRWQAAGCAAILILLGGSVSAAAPKVVLDLPADVFVHGLAGGTPAGQRLPEISLDLDLRALSRKPDARSLALRSLTQRLRASLTPEVSANFELFLYVNKAVQGPYAQHMYVFRKLSRGRFKLVQEWEVSTGREKVERNALGDLRFTVTPSGYYEIDPARIYVTYHSRSWNETMDHTLFFDAWYRGKRVGLAIHAAGEDEIRRLGSRASAGCVRLSPADARALRNDS